MPSASTYSVHRRRPFGPTSTLLTWHSLVPSSAIVGLFEVTSSLIKVSRAFRFISACPAGDHPMFARLRCAVEFLLWRRSRARDAENAWIILEPSQILLLRSSSPFAGVDYRRDLLEGHDARSPARTVDSSRTARAVVRTAQIFTCSASVRNRRGRPGNCANGQARQACRRAEHGQGFGSAAPFLPPCRVLHTRVVSEKSALGAHVAARHRRTPTETGALVMRSLPSTRPRASRPRASARRARGHWRFGILIAAQSAFAAANTATSVPMSASGCAVGSCCVCGNCS